ncbi:hypothetical protein P8452_11015 [Trifolium repens]|nr:hypothetical protein P8452_11015 [Trifolium repens]
MEYCLVCASVGCQYFCLSLWERHKEAKNCLSLWQAPEGSSQCMHERGESGSSILASNELEADFGLAPDTTFGLRTSKADSQQVFIILKYSVVCLSGMKEKEQHNAAVCQRNK